MRPPDLPPTMQPRSLVGPRRPCDQAGNLPETTAIAARRRASPPLRSARRCWRRTYLSSPAATSRSEDRRWAAPRARRHRRDGRCTARGPSPGRLVSVSPRHATGRTYGRQLRASAVPRGRSRRIGRVLSRLRDGSDRWPMGEVGHVGTRCTARPDGKSAGNSAPRPQRQHGVFTGAADGRAAPGHSAQRKMPTSWSPGPAASGQTARTQPYQNAARKFLRCSLTSKSAESTGDWSCSRLSSRLPAKYSRPHTRAVPTNNDVGDPPALCMARPEGRQWTAVECGCDSCATAAKGPGRAAWAGTTAGTGWGLDDNDGNTGHGRQYLVVRRVRQ
jgi:hypothetical protein